ncbi:MAG: hypothetical protein AAFX44_17970 [Pseudomonadota bacterium]
MATKTELTAALADWDGRSKAAIQTIYATWAGDPDLPALLVESAAREDLQVAATWLLKHGIENRSINVADVQVDLLRVLDRITASDACLHVLQIIDRFQIPKTTRRRVERFVRRCLAAENKFLLTWAYAGFHALASQHAEYREEVSELLEHAEATGSAATRARVRKLKAQGFRDA